MKIIYDTKTDILTIILKDTSIIESDEEKQGIILDYDAAGDVVSLEILDAKKRVSEPTQISYQVAAQSESLPGEVQL
ncbi:MAG: DUF2283 domain-containing protein [Desulfobacterales bacterium]